MGSLRTHLDRLTRLREAGLSNRELERMSSPIGLDLGGRTPQEIAVAARRSSPRGMEGSGAHLSACVEDAVLL